jgi:anhydro-N-acetylmuramic acid kinase
VSQTLLARLLSDEYFSRPAPKSTGLEYFSPDWLGKNLTGDERPQDLQATLRELTAAGIATAINEELPNARAVYLCGGGARNSALKHAIDVLIPNAKVTSTMELGIGPEWVEACAFAWLARQRLEEKPGNLPSVTGASRMAVLGALHLP